MGISSMTARVNVLAQSFETLAKSADTASSAVKSARPEMRSTESAASRALNKLKEAAGAFGGQFASGTGTDASGGASGGYVTPAYALDIVKQYAAILDELNSKSDLAMLHGPKLKLGLQQLEGFFAKFFPQFGRLSKLAKEWQDEMATGADMAGKTYRRSKNLGSGRGKGSGGDSGSSANGASSTGLVL